MKPSKVVVIIIIHVSANDAMNSRSIYNGGDSLQFLADIATNSNNSNISIHSSVSGGEHLLTQSPDISFGNPPRSTSAHPGGSSSSHMNPNVPMNDTNQDTNQTVTMDPTNLSGIPSIPLKNKKSRLKTHRQTTPSVLEAPPTAVTPSTSTATAAALTALPIAAAITPAPSRAVAPTPKYNEASVMKAKNLNNIMKSPKPTTNSAAPITPASNIVDLTASSPTRSSPRNKRQRSPPASKKQRTSSTATANTATAAEVTPAVQQSKRADAQTKDKASTSSSSSRKHSSMPPPPHLPHPSSPSFAETSKRKSKKLAPNNEQLHSLELSNAAADSNTEPTAKVTSNKSSKDVNTKKDVATLDGKVTKSSGESIKKTAINATASNSSVAPTNNVNKTKTAAGAASPSTNNIPSTPTPTTAPKKKRRTFHDQILYIMLTTCRPYSLKSLAKATNTTAEALNHAMLSFLDKQLVICKEFPSKKGGDGKKLYWANPISLSELNDSSAGCDSTNTKGKGGKGSKGGGGGGAILKDLSKLLSTPQQIQSSKQLRQQLELQCQSIQEQLNPLLAIPTMKELDEQCTQEEEELNEIQSKINDIRNRIADASNAAHARKTTTAPTYNPHDRFKKKTPPAPQDPITLKRKINHMLGEYKSRKRKCLDFVEQLSDAMEKKPKDVIGDKILALETDEMEWGTWEDGGKVMGGAKVPGRGAGGGRMGMMGGRKGLGAKGGKENDAPMVKIPAKYTDI